MEEPGWMTESSAHLRVVASVDPRPDTVEEVLNVCPQQASSFGGRHLRLAWVDSPPDPTQGWAGHRGPARVRVDTALRAQDPAVLIMPGPVVGARDPVVDLLACAIPPHFVQPWATVEVVRDSDGDDAGDSRGDATSTLLRRPEAVLELLRGCAVETGSVIYLLPAPTDAVCRGIRLLCRRAPEFVIPPLLTFSPETSVASRYGGGGETAGGGRRSSKKGSSSGRPRESGRPLGGGEGAAGEELEAGVGKRGGAPVRGPTRDRGDTEKGRPTRAAMAEEVGTDVRQPRHAPAAATSNGRERGEGGQSAGGGGGDWASRLSKWGVVTTCSEIVTPHKALEVWYHDVAVAAAAAAATAATAVAATTAGQPRPPRGEPDWIETVLRSHEPSVVDDLTAALELAEGPLPATDGVGAVIEDTDKAGEERRAVSAGSAGNGALLVHGPPGVGKTRLVEALAARLGCRLVKVSPGRLAAAAGVQADRRGQRYGAFRYCRQCVSHRVLLLLDSIDRLTPAAEGNVGASRGEVDAGVLNTFVLAVEQSRRDSRWRGRVAVVGITSWPDQVHPTARRCAGQEILVLPPSQPLRAEILKQALLRHAFLPPGQETIEKRGECFIFGDARDAFAEVVGLCQGFTAGDMCAVSAAALELWDAAAAAAESQPPGEEWGAGARDKLSPGEALRAGFRQIRQRVAAGRGGGAGSGTSTSIYGVPSVRWSEVGGLERAKRAVQEMVVWPARFPEAFSRMGITPASGVLLFGPPGTGKTLLAKAAATETGATFIELKISDVVRGEIGESEKAVTRAFRTARELAPSIVFIDEFQALFASRDAGGGTGSRLASQLLVCMDELARWRAAGLRVPDATRERSRQGVDNDDDEDGRASTPLSAESSRVTQSGRISNVMVLAATNAPEAVDTAFLRPGRFDEIVYAGLPDAEGRQHILQAAKARMEGLRTTGGMVAAEAGAAAGAVTESAKFSSGEDAPPEGRKAECTTPIVAAAAADSTDASATTTAEGAVVLEEPVKKKTVRPDGSSIGGGGGGGGGSGRTRGGGGRWASDVDLTWLSQQTKGYSGADLSSLVRNTAMIALLEEREGSEGGTTACQVRVSGRNRVDVDIRAAGRDGGTDGVLVLARRHFNTALASTEPSSGPEAVARHERWARQWHVT
ncbi:unnamed protein product [Pylaiella littoralis]